MCRWRHPQLGRGCPPPPLPPLVAAARHPPSVQTQASPPLPSPPMAARRGNKQWLRQQLQKALGWDVDTADALVESVAAAGGSRPEVASLVEAFTGGSDAAMKAALQFCGLPAVAGAGDSGLAGGGRSSGEPAGSGSRPGSAGGRGGAAAPPQAVELAGPSQKAKVGVRWSLLTHAVLRCTGTATAFQCTPLRCTPAAAPGAGAPRSACSLRRLHALPPRSRCSTWAVT